ncbi:hypothetical protein [Chroogloeocystis siderophila]|uniref:hypothetical protein n=1 Tax=Chroogloeocystis siderophila TaxID=329163 RepID=UPI0015BD0AF8|nr:hypothetical protein [Chroogloeocystis siderophila]
MTITDKMRRSLPVPPGSFGLPVIGETLSFLHDPNFMQRRQQQHRNIHKTHVFGRPTVVMIGAEANRFLFGNEICMSRLRRSSNLYY